MNYKLYMKSNPTNSPNITRFITCKNANVNVSKEYHGNNWYSTHSAQWDHNLIILTASWQQVQDTAGITVKHGDNLSAGWYDNGTGATEIHIRMEIDNKLVHERVISNTTECFTTYRVGVGDQPGTPTYLETLDKLDQWSSAQYIPNSRNKLNL